MGRRSLAALLVVLVLALAVFAWLGQPEAGAPVSPSSAVVPSEDEVRLDAFALVGEREITKPAGAARHELVPLAELRLEDFQACYEVRDEACCRDFIMDWFQFPAAGVSRLLGMLPGLANGADARTLALLLQSAMVLMEEDPGSFAPWSAGSLIATTVGLADENAFMSKVLLEGLGRFGKAAHAEDFDTILSLYGGGAQQHDAMTQLDQIRLLGAWIQDISEEEVGRFEVAYASRDITDNSYHLMGARLLIERDVESGVDFLTQAMDEMCAEYSSDDPFVLAARNSLHIGLSVAFGPERPKERVGLVEGLAAHPEQLSYYIGTMEPTQLGDILAVAEGAAFDTTTQNLFEVYTEGPGQEVAALELMQSAEFAGFAPNVMADLQVRNFEHGFTRAYNESMQAQFRGRFGDPVAYWSELREVTRHFESQEQVEQAVLPWLAASEGETSPYRRGVIQDLQRRFPGLDWVE
jgi:hypothetical protein